MAYKNDSYLVIANKFGSASGDAKAQLWETYDQLRDLTVSGNGLGSGFGATGGFLYNIKCAFARFFSRLRRTLVRCRVRAATDLRERRRYF